MSAGNKNFVNLHKINVRKRLDIAGNIPSICLSLCIQTVP